MYVLHTVGMVCYLSSKEPCFPRKWPWQCIKDLNAIKKYYYWYTIILLQIIGLYKRGFSLNSIPVIFKINTPLGTCCTDSFPSVTSKFALQGLYLHIIKQRQNELNFQCNIVCNVLVCCPCNMCATYTWRGACPYFTFLLHFPSTYSGLEKFEF